MREPLVCVIVLNWNGKELLRECLESLQQTAYGAMTVVVVDNGSSDGSALSSMTNFFLHSRQRALRPTPSGGTL